MATRGIDSRTNREIILYAIKNAISTSSGTRKFSTKEECVEYIKKKGIGTFVGISFAWLDSPEGWQYWKDVRDSIMDSRI